MTTNNYFNNGAVYKLQLDQWYKSNTYDAMTLYFFLGYFPLQFAFLCELRVLIALIQNQPYVFEVCSLIACLPTIFISRWL